VGQKSATDNQLEAKDELKEAELEGEEEEERDLLGEIELFNQSENVRVEFCQVG
jgi:hypothetical protein